MAKEEKTEETKELSGWEKRKADYEIERKKAEEVK